MSKVILLRHGETLWSTVNRFTGWADVPLTETGKKQTQEAGKILREEGLVVDCAFSSVLRRSIDTVEIILDEMKQFDVPTQKSWKLNERHYGALQGLFKNEIAEKYGEEQVLIWRRSFDVRPPGVGVDDERNPIHDPLYADVKRSVLPSVETLADVMSRVIPYWREFIAPELRKGKTVLVAVHGNTIRAIIKYVDSVSDDDIVTYDIPYATPLLYEFSDTLEVQSSRYLGNQESIQEAIEAIKKQGKID